MNTKELLLVGIVKEYIKSREPIGSMFLKTQQNLNISSATIRNYFKILEKEGALYQPHISSGRIPTHAALHSYWKDSLHALLQNDMHISNIQNIKSLSKNYNLYCVLAPKKSNVLKKVLCVENKYLILQFSRNEIVINYSEALCRFLESLIDTDMQDLIKIANGVGAGELERRLALLEYIELEENTTRFGVEFLRDIAYGNAQDYFEFLYARVLSKYQNGIYFEQLLPQGYIAIIHNVNYNDLHTGQICEARMMCVGSLLIDYKSFYTELGFTSFV